MKTHPTIAGNAYVVFSKTGCTVTDSTGSLNKAVPAGDWMTIPAPSDALILTDDNAIVRNANFSLAPTQSSVSEGGGTGEYADIFPLSNVWTGSNAFFGDVTFSKKPTFPEGAVLSQAEADERYTLKGEGGGGNDCGLTPEEVEKLSIYANAEGRSITPALNLATEVGHTYTVTAKGSDIDVTASNGDPLCSVPAGSQLSFVAIGTTTKLSSTDCTITENFKGAAHVVLSGGGSSEGGGSTGGGEPEGDYLLFNADRSVRGGRLDTLTNGYSLLYNVTGQTEWRIPLPKLQNGESMFAQTSIGGEWHFDLPELVNGRNFLDYTKITAFTGRLPKLQDAYCFFRATPIKTFTAELPELLKGETIFDGAKVEYINVSAPKVTTLRASLRQTSVTEIHLYAPLVTNCNDFASSASSLRVVNAEFPSLDTALKMFYGCKLDKPSVLKVCNSLPSWNSGSHPITLGIHIDHKYDPEVNAALKRLDPNYEPLNLPIDETTGEYIEITENKGWTLTVQWNGTATENAYPTPAATYSLRPQVAPVYAKLGEEFDGKPMLDWGHYVTNWEENGYMEFASLEEAKEYFNITE